MHGDVLQAVKVGLKDSFRADADWVMVEDGRLAPLGSHTEA